MSDWWKPFPCSRAIECLFQYQVPLLVTKSLTAYNIHTHFIQKLVFVSNNHFVSFQNHNLDNSSLKICISV